MIKAWDSDGHVSESEVTFSDKYWDPKLKDRRPTIIETGPDGPLYWMIDTRSFPVRSGPFQQAGFPLSKNGKSAKVTPGISPYDPVESAEMRSVKSRLEQLDREKTAVQVIYPTMFLSYPITYDRDLAVAMMRAYNSWIADLTSQAPDRLKWVTLVDPVDPHVSVEEIKRTKKMGSVAVMLLGVTGDIRIDDPPMEPIWAAANEVGLPVAVHTGHSFRALGNVNDTHHDKTAISFWLTVQFAFQRVISKGIADRYPNLRIAFLEAGCSWVPSLVERITDYSGFPGAAPEKTLEEATTPSICLRNTLRGGRFTLASRLMRNCFRLRSRSLETSAGFMARIFLMETGFMARSMFFSKEKTLARKASESSLSITPRAFMDSMFRMDLNRLRTSDGGAGLLLFSLQN